jgi:anthranilate phosphoribosyltransferase
MMHAAIGRLVEGLDLERDTARAAVSCIMAGEATPAQIASFLTALRMKGEAVAEIIGAAEAMRAHAVRLPDAPRGTLDTCGTGGDARGTFNISTAAALVAAAAGVPVAKHGNRSVTSRCGSADVLEALGVPLDPPIERIARSLVEARFAFLFAPYFHSAMRHAAPVRREIGIRTIFNIVGPLTNPAGASYQLVGVFRRDLAALLARALGELGAERAWVVHGTDGLDEITLAGPTHVAAWETDTLRTFAIDPEAMGLRRAPAEALTGGTAQENAALVLRILRGADGPARDVVLLNAGAALVVAGRAEDLADGMRLAAHAVDSGAALATLDHARRVLSGSEA